MSQIANITVFDGAAVPVSHTLVAISVNREKNKTVALWREQLTTVPAYAQIHATLTQETLKSGVVKVEWRTVVPVMEAILNQNAAGYTAAPKVAYEDVFITTSYQHPRSAITGRRLVRQMGVNIAGNIATSVAPVATGPLPEAFDLQSLPT